MFSLPTTVTVAGTEYPVRTDFRVILEIFVMLEDPDLVQPPARLTAAETALLKETGRKNLLRKQSRFPGSVK